MPNNLVVDKILSVIVPVYNVENTLERCVQSIEEQDLPHDEFEVILVNDGSTDNSLDIANDLASRYGNIIVLSKENGGPSAARNMGMDKANGKYFMFVDADDFLVPNSISELIELCIHESFDLIHFYANVEMPDGSENHNIPDYPKCGTIYRGEEMLMTGNLIGSVWSNIVKSSLIRNNRLRFPEGFIHEDAYFTTCLLCYVQRLLVVDMEIYHYSYSPDSLWHSSNIESIRKNLYDSAMIASMLDKFANMHTEISLASRYSIQRLNNTGLIGLLFSCLRNPQFSVSMMTDFLTYAHSLGVYPVRGNFLNRRTKLLSKLFNHSRLYMKMYKWRKTL